ncbi:MAG TPA: GAF and ANTAR domain-containing protein [Acidimicrobiales bacterium]|nr:GAF and ANTAR domain-containing protein [Acidimicrobiales bacterium]
MPHSPDPVRAALDALAGFLIGTAPLDGTLRYISQVTVDAFPAAHFAGISTLVDGEPRTAVFTHETAVDIDSAQYETGEGPCLDAYRHKAVYRIDDTEVEKRWPAFASTAADHGIRSTFSLPMISNDEGFGALNLYSPDVEGFAEADADLGLALAGQAATLLANSQIYWDAHQLTESLQEAMRSRAQIEQAKGILMVSSRCTADEAFALLVRASQRENRKLRDIAAEMVERAQRRDAL